jgi:hypothetical protein
MDHFNNDFLQIFHYKEKTNIDFIVKQILYTSNSSWVIQQYIYDDTHGELKNVLDNNIKELLSKFKTNDIIKYIFNNLINMYYRFKQLKLNILFLKIFFQNIKIDILKKIVKTIIFKNNKYHQEITNTLLSIYNIIGENNVFFPLINELNNLTIKYISNNNIVDGYKIYVNNNNIANKFFNYNLSCIDIILSNTINYVKENKSTYIDLDILYLVKDVKDVKDDNISLLLKLLLCTIEKYSLNLHKNIKEYNIHDGKLLKNIMNHFHYIYQLKDLKKIINYPLIVKNNINSIIHNDDILKYFVFGLSKVIMNVINNNDNMSVIYDIISYFKFINNIDMVLQYYYESLKIRVKYYLINNINHVTVLNVENKLLEYLELVIYSKLQISNEIYNYIDSLKTSIDFKLNIGIEKSIFIHKKLIIDKYNVNIPTIFELSKDVDNIKAKYKTVYNTDNRDLELSYKDTIVKLSINNITITGSLLPMSMLYYYGTSDKSNIDVFNDMFNNQNEDLMTSTLNILKNNNLIINDKLNIPTSNIILNENIIDYNKIIEKINYDRNTITKCYIMKTAKTLKNNIKKEDLYNFTKQSLKYFDLDKDMFEDMLKYCIDKELLGINSCGLLEY